MNISKKTLKIIIPIISVVLVLAIAAIIILPRPNLKMDDMKKAPTKIGILMKYGLPTGGFGGDLWVYGGGCIEFYGEEFKLVEVNFATDEITFLGGDISKSSKLEEKISIYGDLKREGVIYNEYLYEDAHIKFSDLGMIIFSF